MRPFGNCCDLRAPLAVCVVLRLAECHSSHTGFSAVPVDQFTGIVGAVERAAYRVDGGTAWSRPTIRWLAP